MEIFQLIAGDGPLMAAAIHNGHAVRESVAERLAVSETDRRREEDPYTDELIAWCPTRMIGLRSRYEFDLNRPREEAVYLKPEHAWGVDVWKEPPTLGDVNQSLANYDLFYATAETVLQRLVDRHGRVLVLDVHSYNHRRAGPQGAQADAAENPEVNIGTGSLSRQRWGTVVDAFIEELRAHDYLGRRLDVRENVKFRGGQFCRWVHQTFPESVCALAIEFKKFFMDEWTDAVDQRQLMELRRALALTAPRMRQEFFYD